MAIGLGVRLATEGVGGLETGLISGLVSGVGLAVLLVPGALRGEMGWGDVKLMGGVGAGAGLSRRCWRRGAFISLVGAFQAVVTLIWKGEVWDTLAAVGRRWAMRARLLSAEARPATAAAHSLRGGHRARDFLGHVVAAHKLWASSDSTRRGDSHDVHSLHAPRRGAWRLRRLCCVGGSALAQEGSTDRPRRRHAEGASPFRASPASRWVIRASPR